MDFKILLVEDDTSLGYVIKDQLESNNFLVSLEKDGESAYNSYLKNKYDLLILDVMLPVMDGFTLAKKIREKDTLTPLLFLSAKALLEDRLKGLKIGADDYLTKPFSMEELLLKIEVFLKRRKVVEESSEISIGDYMFRPESYELLLNGEAKSLTKKESQLLLMLCQNRDMVIKRNLILENIWGKDDYFLGRSLDVFISRLRKYLKEDPKIKIVNCHGVGFKLQVGKIEE